MKNRSDYLTSVIALGIVCGGLVLIVVGQGGPFQYAGIDFAKLLVSVGSTVTFIGVLHWLYDTYTKKTLHAELFEVILGSKSVVDSGIAQFFADSRDIRFKELIDDSSELTTLFSYNSRFLEDYEVQIDRLLHRGGSVEFMFLGKDSATVKLMKALGWEESSMVAHYNKIARFEERLNAKYPGKCRIRFVDAILRYSAVKLDNSLFVIWNTCSNTRQTVPALCIRSRTPLGEFLSADISNTKEESSVND